MRMVSAFREGGFPFETGCFSLGAGSKIARGYSLFVACRNASCPVVPGEVGRQLYHRVQLPDFRQEMNYQVLLLQPTNGDRLDRRSLADIDLKAFGNPALPMCSSVDELRSLITDSSSNCA